MDSINKFDCARIIDNTLECSYISIKNNPDDNYEQTDNLSKEKVKVDSPIPTLQLTIIQFIIEGDLLYSKPILQVELEHHFNRICPLANYYI